MKYQVPATQGYFNFCIVQQHILQKQFQVFQFIDIVKHIKMKASWIRLNL